MSPFEIEEKFRALDVPAGRTTMVDLGSSIVKIQRYAEPFHSIISVMQVGSPGVCISVSEDQMRALIEALC